MRISDWSSDVCSSDLIERQRGHGGCRGHAAPPCLEASAVWPPWAASLKASRNRGAYSRPSQKPPPISAMAMIQASGLRSEEHTSELQSLMRISYAVFCLKKKNITIYKYNITYESLIQNSTVRQLNVYREI